MSFKALEDIFHMVPLPVNARVEGRWLILHFGETAAWNGAAGGSLFMAGLAEGQTVEPLVPQKWMPLKASIIRRAAVWSWRLPEVRTKALNQITWEFAANGALLTLTVLFQWWTACAAIAGFVFGVFVRDFVWLRGINKTWPFNLEIMDWPKVERLAGKDPVD